MIQKHRACASEFDYSAWKELGDWRRNRMVPLTPSTKHTKDCWRKCDYPSECRWKNIEAVDQFSPHIPDSPAKEKILVELPATEVKKQQVPASSIDTLLAAINNPSVALQTLLSSSCRKRTSRKKKSPLHLHVIEEEDEDGDTVMR